MGWIGCSI
jgi:hypothetical protein